MKKQPSDKKPGLIIAGLTVTGFVTGCDTVTHINPEQSKRPINLDAVKQAFQENENVHVFESRVNEIFEGEAIVIFALEEKPGGFAMHAHEDKNNNATADTSDDMLFTLSVINGKATLKGHGLTRSYNETWPYNPPAADTYTETTTNATHHSQTTERDRRRRHGSGLGFFPLLYHGRGWNGYNTPRDRVDAVRTQRSNYRNTPDYKQQVSKNRGYEKAAAKKYGGSFRKAPTSSTRSSSSSRGGSSRGSSGFGI
ncbi:MAG: hypothetical protein AAF492_10265 [Verrucomicrobiota bacterium]